MSTQRRIAVALSVVVLAVIVMLMVTAAETPTARPTPMTTGTAGPAVPFDG